MHDIASRRLTQLAPVISAGLQRKLEAWDGLLERLPVAVYTCASDGRILQYNRRAAELWGREPKLGDPQERFCGAFALFQVDGRPLPHGETPMAEVLRSGKPAHDREVVIRRSDGTAITALVNIDPLFDDDGVQTGAVNCFQDITALKRAERRLEEHQAWLEDLLEALPVALYTTDADGRLTRYNRAAAELWGYRPEIGTLWCGSWRIYRPDGTLLPHDQCPMALAIKEGRPVRGVEAVAERPDGTRVPFLPFPTPLRDDSGRIVGAVNMLVDISERKAHEAALAAETRRQKALLDELNHRVKNTLATVQSLASQTFRGAEPMPALVKAFEGRLLALSKTHSQLSRAQWESADLISIVEDVFAPYRGGERDRVHLSGEPLRLAPQTALIVAMVLHELATNAVKYGSLSGPQGRLDIAWRLENGSAGAERRLCIDWRETGGPPVRVPARRGFGSQLLERGIARQLGGSAELEFDPKGVRCSLGIPLAR